MITVRKTKSGDESFSRFQNFPKEIYPPELIHFNPEEMVDEEMLFACYIAMHNDKVCARAAVYNNPDLYYQSKKSLCIGNYEAVDDEAFSSALFSFIFEDIKQTGAEYIIGPMNGSTWNNYRFSLHHNQPNFFLEPYHHLYYNEQFLAAGFEVIAKYFSSIDTHLEMSNPDLLAWETGFQQAGVVFRSIDCGNYEEELKRLYRFNSFAFQKNFLYTPISEENEQLYDSIGENKCRLTFTVFFKTNATTTDELKMYIAGYQMKSVLKRNMVNIKKLTEHE